MNMERCKFDFNYCMECAHVQFRALDISWDGIVTFEEWTSKNKIKKYSMQKLRQSFDILDRNKSGFIDEFEFSLAFVERYWGRYNFRNKMSIKDLIDSHRLNTDEKYCWRTARNMFNHLMRNINNKFIDSTEFKKFMLEWLENVDERIVNDVFKSADRDGSNTIDNNEFVYAFMSEHFWKYDPERKRDVDYFMKTRACSVNEFFKSQYKLIRGNGTASNTTFTHNNRINTSNNRGGTSVQGSLTIDNMFHTKDSFYSRGYSNNRDHYETTITEHAEERKNEDVLPEMD
eukprot:Mrub_07444.p1 GENE.Mrub_07444~~Mrub_07444.p1  ORF type:complete len:299 (-),score=81.76 Mrub_07444:23-886(-)